MSFLKNSQFTALTASIVMGGEVVGGLQTLTVDENWNMTRVGEIGSVADVVHVPGRYQVNLTARRMFIERDLIMSALAVLPETEEPTTPLTDYNDGIEDTDTDTVIDKATAGSAALTRNAKAFHYSFDVVVKDAGGAVIFSAIECSITSRRRTVDQGAIIVAEDVNMIAKKVTLGSGITTGFTNGANSGLGEGAGA